MRRELCWWVAVVRLCSAGQCTWMAQGLWAAAYRCRSAASYQWAAESLPGPTSFDLHSRWPCRCCITASSHAADRTWRQTIDRAAASALKRCPTRLQGCDRKTQFVQAETELLSSDAMVVTRLLDCLGTNCRERLAAANAETDIERLQVLNGLLFGPREQPERCVAHAASFHTQSRLTCCMGPVEGVQICIMPVAKLCCCHNCPLTLASIVLWLLLICCGMKLQLPGDSQLPCTAAVRTAEAWYRSSRGRGCMCWRLAMAWGSRCSEARLVSC